ncbi:MAG: hypothetical protein ONB05_06300 [candidate division KSB1 bacterium]|nr:hypothetical protein [candidate division KSB1 bacterium]
MSRAPKLKIKISSGDQSEFICELEEAKNYLNFNEGIFLVEGQGVHSYEELVKIVTLDKYKSQEFVEVDLLHIIGGG